MARKRSSSSRGPFSTSQLVADCVPPGLIALTPSRHRSRQLLKSVREEDRLRRRVIPQTVGGRERQPDFILARGRDRIRSHDPLRSGPIESGQARGASKRTHMSWKPPFRGDGPSNALPGMRDRPAEICFMPERSERQTTKLWKQRIKRKK